MTIKLFWENKNPVPARTTKTLKSSWNFVPDAERKQTVSMYPYYDFRCNGSRYARLSQG